MESGLRDSLLCQDDFKLIAPLNAELNIYQANLHLPSKKLIPHIINWTHQQSNSHTFHGKNTNILGASGRKYPIKWSDDVLLIPQFIDVKFNRDNSSPEKFIYQQSWVINKEEGSLTYFILGETLDQIPYSIIQYSKDQIADLNSEEPQLKMPISFFPKKEQWELDHIAVLKELRDKTSPINKIVMARSIEVETESSPQDLYNILSKNSDKNLFRIFSKERDSIFMSFTPESFIQIKDSVIGFDSLAGTRPRGQTENEDKELERELLSDDKELREHKSVTDTICQKLKNYGEVKTGKTEILKLSKVQHLKTPITLIRNEEKTKLNLSPLLDQMIHLLHPTPAVSGGPKAEALTFLKRLDHFVRNDYAGLKGYIYQENSEIAVGIRSLKYIPSKKKIILYAGAGIVEGSHSQREWDETSAKINSFFPFLNEGMASNEELSSREAPRGQ